MCVVYYHILAYSLLSVYLFKLGKVLNDVHRMKKSTQNGLALSSDWLDGEKRKKKKGTDTQTKKSTKTIFQQGKHRRIAQGIRRISKTKWKGQPNKVLSKQKYRRRDKVRNFDTNRYSVHQWELFLEHKYSSSFDCSCNTYHHYLDTVIHGLEIIIKVGETTEGE